MTITLITLLLATIFFAWGKIRSDIVALLALLSLSVSGVITTGEALSGFSNSIVIMMIGLFVVGGAIFNTGLAKMIGARLVKMAGGSQMRLFVVVIVATSFIGAFVSNTGTVALMLPIVVSMAAASDMQPSRLLMPLAFASSMGGMLTLIGTPPNLVISEVWEEAGNSPLSFFSFFPAGIICVCTGTLLLIPLSKWFLSKKGSKKSDENNENKTLDYLMNEYGLNSQIYKAVVTPESELCGLTIKEADLRKTYNIDILEVRPYSSGIALLKNVEQEEAKPDTIFRNDDLIYIRGNKDDVGRFIEDYQLSFQDESESEDNEGTKLDFYRLGIAEIVLMPNSSIINSTTASIKFRERYGVNVVAIKRKQKYITTDLAVTPIKAGDMLLVQGTWAAIGKLSGFSNDWVIVGQPLNQAAAVTLDYKAPIAAAIMVAMVIALVFDFIPPVLSVMTAAILTVLTGCFRNVEDAYKTINWESVVLIAAMMPMSFAMEKTGLSTIVADSLIGLLGSMGPITVLAGIYFTTSVMTLFISNTATAVLLAPIAMTSATALGVNPLPYLFAVTFGASLCFASPFSTPPNALVMTPGEYTFADYLKVGLPLQLLLGIVMIITLPLIFPF